MKLDPEGCYRAVRSRDPRFDGRFFSAVLTTGIYCRPVCPARTPKMGNMRFFGCAAAAEEAGFRPCRRCHPEAAPGTPAWVGTSATVARALRLIARGDLDAEPVATLAGKLGIGERHLRRLFARHLGASPRRIAVTRRIHFARRLLAETDLPMRRVAVAAGFPSVRQFNHAILDTFGMAPSRLRRENGGKPRNGSARWVELRLPYRPPYPWGAVLGFLAARAIPGVEATESGVYRRVVRTPAGIGTIRVRNGAPGHHLILEIPDRFSADLIGIVERVRRLFDLSADPLTIASRLETDPLLKKRIRVQPGLRVPGAWNGFELAVRAILGQQVSVRGARTLAGRLAARHGRPLGDRQDPALTHEFPLPEVLARADLTSIGVPRVRSAAIRRMAREYSRGRLDLDPSSDPAETIGRLKAITGIGDWTARYIAMRAMGEPDSFPAGDLGLRRALARDRKPVREAEILRRAEGWRPWRAYAVMYLWCVPDPEPNERRRRHAGGNRPNGISDREGRPGVP